MDVPVTIGPPAHALLPSEDANTVAAAVSALDVRIDVKGAYIVDSVDEKEATVDDEDYQHEHNDIRLPHQHNVVSHLAVDIGGSLIKLCYWSFEADNKDTGGRMHFLKFPTDRIDACIEYMRQLAIKHRQRNSPPSSPTKSQSAPLASHESAIDDDNATSDLYVVATGGGAYKFYDKIKSILGVPVMREDEMECLIIGLDFFISQVPREIFTFGDAPGSHTFVPTGAFTHPYLLVNMGSGVSIIKVSGPREFTRVGGTSLGGGTLWGLLSLLTGARNFDDMLKLAEKGDNTAVDMLVGDIYGADYTKIGLKSTTIASSFGKVYRTKRQAERDAEDHGGMRNGDIHDPPTEPSNNTTHIPSTAPTPTPSTEPPPPADAGDAASRHIAFKPEDISKSLLYAISNNIGQIAYLHAEKHNCEHIYFGGSFLGGHWQTMATLSYAIKFWSKGSKQAFFLRHEGYLGAVGAFLRRQPVHWGARRGSVEGLFPLSRVGSRT
ncbi:fumble [Microthyrium microscopicum]|uniref:Fumble n=1 Tax=Microthyrium microscopicum TaxID=703497 RepID=A0A6A6U2Y4_9PEZI|nr:fumble [Microthyrium microscopicum]